MAERGDQVASVSTVLTEDEPVFFTSGPETLLGFHSRPRGPIGSNDRRTGVLLLSGGWLSSSTGRNRTLVTLARALASRSLHAFRFDYHGVADSSGTLSKFDLNSPFSEDALAATECLRSRGIDSVVLVGACFGGQTLLKAARRIEGLEGVVLIAVSTRDSLTAAEERAVSTEHRARKFSLYRVVRVGVRPWMIKDIFRAERRRYYGRFVRAKLRRIGRTITHPFRSFRSGTQADGPAAPSKALVESLAGILARNVPVLLLYGSQDRSYQQFLDTREVLCTLPGYSELVDVQVLDGDVHGFGRVEVQDAIVHACVEWIANIHKTNVA